MLVASNSNKNAYEYLKNIGEYAQKTLELNLAKTENLAHASKKLKSMFILGDNIHGVTARQISLLFKEKCLMLAEGMTAPDYRHGALEVTEPGMTFFISQPTNAHRSETEIHANFIKKLGGNIILSSHTNMDCVDNDSFLPIFKPNMHDEEDVLSHITAILPFQLLTLEIAKQRGFDVDGFRYLSKVVASY